MQRQSTSASSTASRPAPGPAAAAASANSLKDGPEGAQTVLEFSVHIRGVQVRNLVPKDAGGTSDPYVSFCWDAGGAAEASMQTEPQIKCLDAKWEHVDFDFEFK